MQTSLLGIAKKAQNNPKHRFGNLYGCLNEEYLLECWQYVKKNAASGVDKVSAREYEVNLQANIKSLVERLKSNTYRAKLIRRVYIPKESGKLRALGLPSTEDKLLQCAVSRILNSIYEQDFLRCSYGYRPKIGVLDAVDKLTVKLQFGRYRYVVEADIRSYFDTIDHTWLIKMLEQRVADKSFLRLIKKWLKAGVLETDGKVICPETGTPQGGVVSPVLSNVFLHYCLDLWFRKEVTKRCKGEAFIIRYADDYVCGFEHKHEVEKFFRVMPKRLAKFGLELSEEKTQIIEFDRNARGKTSFEFLGFEFRWGEDRKGKPHLKRTTSKKKFRSSIKRFAQWCRAARHLPITKLFDSLRRRLVGYYNHYAIMSNGRMMQLYFLEVQKILYKWLNRRSQRKSYTWQGFNDLMRHFSIPAPQTRVRPRR